MNQFNVYDIFGYLLPGALVVLVSAVAFSPYLPISLQPTVGGSLIVVVACYIVGHFLRAAIADRIKSLKPKPSETLLSPANCTFSDEIKTEIAKGLTTLLGFASKPIGDLTSKEQQQYFDLAYALIMAKNCAGNVPIYNSLYALYRGLMAASGTAAVIVILSFCLSLRSSPTTEGVIIHAVPFLVFALLTWKVPLAKRKPPLRQQFDRYANLFSKGVYVYFLAWHRTQGNRNGSSVEVNSDKRSA